MIGVWEVVIVLVLIGVVYFVGRKAPEIARNVGSSMREFKQGLSEVPSEMKKGYSEKPKKK